MIRGGNATVFVSNMDRAVRFYTEALGLALAFRAGDDWAQIDAGDGFQIGLHPASPSAGQPGTVGATQVGLNVSRRLEDVVEALQSRGVPFDGPIVEDEHVRLAFLKDPDGNVLYLCQMQHAPSAG